jgi:hypothetical protein
VPACRLTVRVAGCVCLRRVRTDAWKPSPSPGRRALKLQEDAAGHCQVSGLREYPLGAQLEDEDSDERLADALKEALSLLDSGHRAR